MLVLGIIAIIFFVGTIAFFITSIILDEDAFVALGAISWMFCFLFLGIADAVASAKAEQELLEEKWANAVENNYTFYVDGQEVDEKYLIKDAYIIEYDDENCVVKLAYKSEVN